MRKKSFIPLIFVGLVLLIVVAPVSARDVENHGTITIGEEHLNLKFLEGSETKMFGWWKPESSVVMSPPYKTINLGGGYDDVSFPASEFEDYSGTWYELDEYGMHYINASRLCFTLVAPIVTPTPIPTPSEGNIIISSVPSDATVYIDNAIKGITPLTVSVANGEHVVRIRLDGYQESKTSVAVNGGDVSIEPVLIPVTTVATTIPTTIQTTVATTIPTTIQTTVPTTVPTTVVTTIPTTAAINYSGTIVAMQSQINEQATKNAEQDVAITKQSEQIGFLQQMIDSILGFLGLK